MTGNTFLARNTINELKKHNIPITVIAMYDSEQEAFMDADIVVGDTTSVRVLRMAGIKNAQAVMALGDDDSENAFIVLASKEVKGTAKTVCAVNNAKNLSRVRRVHPDMLTAQILGGELLAVAGETPDTESLIQRIFDTGEETVAPESKDS